jgi:hypothetical protein
LSSIIASEQNTERGREDGGDDCCVRPCPHESSAGLPERVHPRSASIRRAEHAVPLHNPACCPAWAFPVRGPLRKRNIKPVKEFGSCRMALSQRTVFERPSKLRNASRHLGVPCSQFPLSFSDRAPVWVSMILSL